MRNTVHEISGCHTINLRPTALQISFRINCSNKVYAFSLCIAGCWEHSLELQAMHKVSPGGMRLAESWVVSSSPLVLLPPRAQVASVCQWPRERSGRWRTCSWGWKVRLWLKKKKGPRILGIRNRKINILNTQVEFVGESLGRLSCFYLLP